MNQKIFLLFFFSLLFVPLVFGDVLLELECSVDNCAYAPNNDITINAYLSSASESVIRAYRFVFLSDDTNTDQFTFLNNADQQDLLFERSFISNLPDSNYEVSSNNYGWLMNDAKSTGATVSSRVKIGEIKGRALSLGTISLSLLPDDNHLNAEGVYILKTGGTFAAYHEFSMQPLILQISGECISSCDQKECGSDGCGGSCGTCGADESCSNSGQCIVNPPPAARCGDGVLNGQEQCDDGNQIETDNCLNTCELPICGDGIVWNQEAGTEQCDDGNTAPHDGCSNVCQIEGDNQCQNVCDPVDSLRCTGLNVEKCTLGANNCLVWQQISTCAPPQTCSNGACAEPLPPPAESDQRCTDVCVENQEQCLGNSVQECAIDGITGCRIWSTTVDCRQDQCIEGRCSPSGCAEGEELLNGECSSIMTQIEDILNEDAAILTKISKIAKVLNSYFAS